MACMEHHCSNCGKQYMDNKILKQCLYCKAQGITNWFDEELDNWSDSGNDDVSEEDYE